LAPKRVIFYSQNPVQSAATGKREKKKTSKSADGTGGGERYIEAAGADKQEGRLEIATRVGSNAQKVAVSNGLKSRRRKTEVIGESIK